MKPEAYKANIELLKSKSLLVVLLELIRFAKDYGQGAESEQYYQDIAGIIEEKALTCQNSK